MMEQFELMMANRYFERRMRTIFVDRVNYKGIETLKSTCLTDIEIIVIIIADMLLLV